MKHFPNLVKVFGILAVLTLAAGCMSNKQYKESLLTQAGFKTVPAKTAAQQTKLANLSQTKITPVKRKGVQYYVFPDVKANVLYVGRQAEYNAYRAKKTAITQETQYAMEAQTSFVSEDAFLNSYGGWDDWDTMTWGY